MAQDKKAEVLATIALVSGLTSTWLKKKSLGVPFCKEVPGSKMCFVDCQVLSTGSAIGGVARAARDDANCYLNGKLTRGNLNVT